MVNFTVATSERWKDKASGEWKEKAEWHRIVVFNEALVKVAEAYLKKGSKVYLEGAMRTRKWTDGKGVERYITEVVLTGFNAKIVMPIEPVPVRRCAATMTSPPPLPPAPELFPASPWPLPPPAPPVKNTVTPVALEPRPVVAPGREKGSSVVATGAVAVAAVAAAAEALFPPLPPAAGLSCSLKLVGAWPVAKYDPQSSGDALLVSYFDAFLASSVWFF